MTRVTDLDSTQPHGQVADQTLRKQFAAHAHISFIDFQKRQCYLTQAYFVSCACILAMIKYSNNPLTVKDANICILMHISSTMKTKKYVHSCVLLKRSGGIHWLVRNRDANLHLQDKYGYCSMDWCFIHLEQLSQHFADCCKRNSSDRNLEHYKPQI